MPVSCLYETLGLVSCTLLSAVTVRVDSLWTGWVTVCLCFQQRRRSTGSTQSPRSPFPRVPPSCLAYMPLLVHACSLVSLLACPSCAAAPAPGPCPCLYAACVCAGRHVAPCMLTRPEERLSVTVFNACRTLVILTFTTRAALVVNACLLAVSEPTQPHRPGGVVLGAGWMCVSGYVCVSHRALCPLGPCWDRACWAGDGLSAAVRSGPC